MDVRKTFLEYFKKNEHKVMPSSSLVPHDDPSVLLTTAGMQQFKPYYLGTKNPPSKKITTLQKCFRTSDIENIGNSDQHLTFFEMLGNFAFADYFKKEAIDFAMDFMLNTLNLDVNKLSIGVFAGDDEIPADIESIALWEKWGIPASRIYKYDKNENFWGPAGETGPCGPCTEIYYDFGEEYGCGKKDCSPSCGCDRFLEVWNLVFTQYNYNGKSYEELPNKNIDTGLGLERIVAVLGGNPSVFRTELFKKIIKRIEELSGEFFYNSKEKGFNRDKNKNIKIIADHSRALTFLITDGVVPSNEGRGYILRRIIRRAIRFGRLLGIEDNFLAAIAEIVISDYHGYYPELLTKKEIIFKIIDEEESRFSRTLREGTKVLEQRIKELKKDGKRQLDPESAFRLYETFGFPVELTVEILKEDGFSLDIEEFKKFMVKHSEISRAKTKFNKKIDKNIEIYKNIAKETSTEFTGYFNLQGTSMVKYILKKQKDNDLLISPDLNEGEEGEIILDKTPFYGEKGGQIGDSGVLKTFIADETGNINTESASGIFKVSDTKIPVDGIIVHSGKLFNGTIKKGDIAIAEVDQKQRRSISKNHTATHILHWSLKTLINKDIRQEGSWVGNERFRFDYNSSSALTATDIEKLEKIINEKIQKDDIVRCFETSREYADEIGAVSLFEEKYGKFVRIVEIDDYSRELCGGIHVKRTGEIGVLKIISDTSIGSNIRRVEAVTGETAFDLLNASYKRLNEIILLLESDYSGIIKKIENLKELPKKLIDEITGLKVRSMKKEILSKNTVFDNTGGLNLISFDFSSSEPSMTMDTKTMGLIGDEIINELEGKNIFIVFGNIINDKPVILLQATKDIVERGIDCSKIAKDIGRILKGGGGGKPEFAQIGGSDNSALRKALDFTENIIMEKIR